jgi:hypothetical protein
VLVLKEVSSILQEVYVEPKAYYEVNAAIYSEYYEDESVLLKDLLFPDLSNLYKTEKFRKLKAEPGTFRKKFTEVLFAGDYTNLKKAMGIDPANINSRIQAAGLPTDTAMQIYSNSSGVAIYFPYSENFVVPLTTSYFDNINTDPFGYLATVIPADREADSAPGSQPVRRKRTVNNEIEWYIGYNSITVNDTYAETFPTHIVGVGAELRQLSPNQVGQVYLVQIGEVKCTKVNYDKLISLGGYLQGGGPDLRFCRGDAYLTQNADQQITSPQNVVQANPTRKQCKKSQWINVYAIWDGNWEINNLNQVFAIYEEDKKGSKTVSLSVKTTVKLDTVTSIEGTVGFSWTFTTEDDIIRQLGWNRESFYLYNQGGLSNGCGVRGGWTVYDCNSFVSYTMPTQ